MPHEGILFSPAAGFSSGRHIPEVRGSALRAAQHSDTEAVHESVRDISEVTFGEAPLLEAVPAGDNRVRVRNTAVFPMRAIAFLRIFIGSEVFGATGWFAGPKTVITAGHVVYTHDPTSAARSGWVGGIEVLPGYDAGQQPFRKASATQFSASNEWVTSANTSFDYGAIFLSEPVGETVGMLGFASVTDDLLRNAEVIVAGYPVSSPDPAEPQGALWEGSAPISGFDTSWVRYPIMTGRGQSGSPVFQPNHGSPNVVGIHAYGSSGSNIGMRINDRVFQHIQQWRLI